MIFIEGHTCAGKTSVGKWFQSRGFFFVDFGPDVIRPLCEELAPGTHPLDWGLQHAEQHGPTELHDTIVNLLDMQLARSGKHERSCVIAGVRSWPLLARLLQPLPPRSRWIVYLDAPSELLRSRFEDKKRQGRHLGDFDVVFEMESKFGLHEIRRRANWVIDVRSDTVFELEMAKCLSEYRRVTE